MILFDQPQVLLALPVLAIAIVVFELRLPGSGARRTARGLLRVLVVGLALGALAGPHTTHREVRPRCLVIAIDTDPRLGAGAAGEAALVRGAAQDAARLAGVRTRVLEYRGDAAAGLAEARLDLDDATGGVILVTDGLAGLAGLARAAADLRAADVAVTAAAVPTRVEPPPPQRRIAALDAPDAVRGPFGIRVALAGPEPDGERVLLRVDGEVVQTLPVGPEVPSEVRFEDLELDPGLHELAVAVESEGARVLALARRLVEVGAPPRVVCLLAEAGAAPWRQALGAQGLSLVDARPEALRDLLTAAGELPDLVVADAASLGRLETEAAALLAQRVHDGLGLVVEPGADASAWAALAASPVAEVLPLVPQREPEPPPPPAPEPPPPDPPPDLDPPEPEEGPGIKAERRPEEALPITLLLVVDRSPSMEGSKMAMAILGAQEAARALSPWDRVGVITFADDVTVDVSPRSARGAASIPLWLSTVEAGGHGTNIAGALKKAHELLEGERSPILHLVLLTDGRQHPPGPIFGPIVKPMRQRGITITAVGIGEGARMDQLRDIVQWAASGMVIRAATPADIPVVLTRDTREVAAMRSERARAIEARLRPEKDTRPPRPPEKDETAPPPRPHVEPTPPPRQPGTAPADERLPLQRVRAHEALADFEDAGWPEVGRPRRVEVAPGGVVLLARRDGRAVLAASRAGLGRVLQWTLPPDDAGAIAWPALGRLFGQAARSVMAPRGAFGYLPAARVVDGPDGALIHVDWPRGASTGVLDARWIGPTGTEPLGRFTPEDGAGGRLLPAAPEGSLCRVELTLPGGPAMPAVSYLARALPSPPPRSADVRALEAALGGPLVEPARFAASFPTVTRAARRETWPLFLWLAIGLLPLDVFLHRRRSRS